MTTFIDASLPQPPAFLYATYPKGTNASGSYPLDPTDNPQDVLSADELNGFSFTIGPEQRRISLSFLAPYPLEYVAIAGRDLQGVVVEVRGSTDAFVSSNVRVSPPTALQGSIAAWFSFPVTSFKFLNFIFTNFASDFRVKHIACGLLQPLPFQADNFCPSPLQVNGSNLISYEGLFLGRATQSVMRPFNLDFGQVTSVEKACFDAVMAACHQTAQGLFYVPDISRSDVHFGAIDQGYKYEPKMSLGQFIIPAIPFSSRAI